MSRTIDFRYVVMRNNADVCVINPASGSSPTVRMDDSAEIKMSLTGSFVQNESVNWLSDRIRAEMIIDGVTYPIGIFLPATVRVTETETGRQIAVEAYDQCWLVRDFSTENRVVINSGANYITAIQQLLLEAGIVLMAATPTTETLAEVRADWEVGTSYLTIVNQLLSEINYKQLWFNSSGVAVLEPKQAPSAENIQHTLDANDVKNLIYPQIGRETDIFSAPNVFICIVTNPDKASNMVATAENDHINSPLSTRRRGRKIVSTVFLDNIASQAALEAYAKNLVTASMYAGETVEIYTGLLPGFGVADVIGLNVPDAFGVCIEHSWEMTLSNGGQMHHTMERVVYQYGTD